MNRSRYELVESTPDRIVIRDIGPWDQFKTVTNDAENVVEDHASILHGRRLFYYDSDGDLVELLVTRGHFVGFKTGIALPAKE